jgi:Immunity protein 8
VNPARRASTSPCTPRWLTKELERLGRPIIGRHLFIVDRIDLPRDIEYLTATLQQFRAETWSELGAKLARIGNLEFEDYIE